MSMGYAEKLSYKKEVGTVGMSEIFDPPEVLQRKIQRLAVMIVRSSHLVAFTGAGISTSCGIPDFRGPKGVWTLQSEGKDVPEASVPFDRAVPSMTHMALVALEKAGILKYVISQNVDSLHLRSGIQREKLSELHGNSFREVCPSCGAEYLRDFEVETIGMKATPRRCSDANCGAKLKDTVLDWQDILPQKEMSQAEKHCDKADLVLCLGTSLQITPACDLPFQSLRRGGRIVIVNLQETPKDKKAALVIHGLVDEVIAGVMDHLNLKVPPFVRVDLFQIRVTHCPRFSEQKYVKWTLSITSVHGPRAPFPFVQSVEVSFPERPDLRSSALNKQPFKLKRETLRTNPLVISLKLHFGDGCKCQWTSVKFLVDFEVQPTTDLLGPGGTASQEQVAEAVHYDKAAVIENLRNLAIEDHCCGQTSLIQRNKCPKQETFVYATTTNIVEYCSHAASATSSEHILKSNDYALKRDGNMSSTSSCAKKLKAK